MIQEIWGNTIFVHRAKYIAKNIEKNTIISPNFLVWKFCGKAQFPHSEKYWEKIIIDTINWRKLSPARKIHCKKYWEKINIDTINWEKLFPPGKIYWTIYWGKISIEKSLLIDPLNTNNTKYRDLLTLRCSHVNWKGTDKWWLTCFKSILKIYSVNLRIQSEYRKIRTRKNSVFGHFSHIENKFLLPVLHVIELMCYYWYQFYCRPL